MVARFTAAEGGEERSEFHVLSRRMGNPRLTVWTRLEASYDHVGLPCQLQVVFRNGLFVHEGDASLGHRLSGTGAARVTVAEVMIIDGADSLASFTASSIVEGSQQDLWPPPEKPAGTPRGPSSLLQMLSQAEKPPRAASNSHDGHRRQSKALGRKEVEEDPGLCSGSDASLGDWSDDCDQGGAAAAGGRAPRTRRAADGQLRQCPSGSQLRQCPTGSDAPAAASGDAAGSAESRRRIAPRPFARQRQEAIERVFGIVRELRAEATFRDTAPRAVISEALNRLDNAGQRFWGATGMYSRRRTALDACAAAWPPDLA